MVHPLLRLLATQPRLLAEHVEAYAELVGDEAGRSVMVWKKRVLLSATAMCLLVVAGVLGGVALMLWAVSPPANIRAPWALIAAPALPALVAIWCAIEARRVHGGSFDDLRQQIAADFSLLREVSAA
jgi:uncharacterized membrane protein YqjE